MMTRFPPSRLGYGCYGLGGAYGKTVSASQAIGLIELAYDLGIRFFDTADSYGSEAILGQALRPFRSKVAIATKVGANGGLSRKQIMASCEASLKRLGADWIDLYQVHYEDPRVDTESIVQTLEDLKHQGKIRYYGVGHLPLTKTRLFIELGAPRAVLAEMNAAATFRYKELRRLQQDHDFGIIAFSVTGRGLLTGSMSTAPAFADGDIRRLDPLFRRSKLAAGLSLARKFADIGRPIQASPAQIAIAWALSQPGVTAALIGPTNPEHLREDCASLALTLEPACLQEIDDFIRHEQTLAQAAITHDIQTILSSPLVSRRQAVADLTYVLEHAIESALIPAAQGRALFTALVQPGITLAALEEIKEKIKALTAVP